MHKTQRSMMLTNILICFVTFEVVTAQINGEFWWLNDKLKMLNKVEPPKPKFDDVDEFDTDDSAKIVFKDNNLHYTEEKDEYSNTPRRTEVAEATIYFRDDSELITPLYVNNKPNINEAQNNEINKLNENRNYIKNYSEDIFNFLFPDDAQIWKNINNLTRKSSPKNYSTETKVNKTVILNNKILLDTENKVSLSENICTVMKKSECSRCNGFPYTTENKSKVKKRMSSQHICCILPLTRRKTSKISFPDTFNNTSNRMKRSTNEDVSPALKQRNALMQRKYGSQIRETQPTLSTIHKSTQKIVTPDDMYIDPYLNIKNSNFKHLNKQQDYQASTSQQEYDNDDVYNDYYAEELPQPGLVGIYSDHKPSSWSFVNTNKGFSYDNVESGEEEIESFGYSTIDPRLGGLSTTAANFKRRLLKVSGSENMLNTESQTVSYLSNPDFQVLQGFKLLNLMTKNKHRPLRILRKTLTTESNSQSGEAVSNFESNIDNDYDDYVEFLQQVYTNCGRTKGENLENYNEDIAVGEAPRGAHPWLILAVLTKRQQSILCYATLIHPRAAVTAADCTYGVSPGEITIVAGVWDLKEDDPVQFQHRLATVHIHQQYLPGKLAYNIALLHWRRPLRLDLYVQPACVADADVDDDCMFVGWGGYDQGIRQRPRWQRASILSRRNCEEHISADHPFDLPIDAFCADVDTKTTFTGLGGPLMCKVDDIYSVAGIAVWRNDVVIIIRAREWVTRAMASLRIH